MTPSLVTLHFPAPAPSGASRLLDLARKGQVELPLTPSAANGVLALCDMAELPYDRMASTILQEPNLAARVLQLANSPFYGSSRPVSNVGHALLRVGERGLRSVLLSAASGKLLGHRVPAGISRALQARATGCALAAEMLGRRTGVKLEAGFAAGVLHDLGRALGIGLALRHQASLPPEWAVNQQAMLDGVAEVHSELGGLVATAWRFPPSLVSAIRYHHDPDLAPPEHAALVGAVHFGLGVLDQLGVFPEASPPAMMGAGPAFPTLSPQAFTELRGEVWQELERLAFVSDRRKTKTPVKLERRRKKL